MLDERIKTLVQAAENLSVDRMTDAQLKVVLDQKPVIEQWLNAVKAHVKERMQGVSNGV